MSPRKKTIKTLIKPKPSIVILLRIQGSTKSNKVELYDAFYYGYIPKPKEKATRYRMKVNGKWFKHGFVTKWEFRDMLFRSDFFDQL